MRSARDRALDLPAEEEEVARTAEAGVVRPEMDLGLGPAAGALHAARTSRDHRAELDVVAVLDHLAVEQELVAADHHHGAGKDLELGQQARHRAPARDLDGAPLRMQVNAHELNDRVARGLEALKRRARELLDTSASGPYTHRATPHTGRVYDTHGREEGEDGREGRRRGSQAVLPVVRHRDQGRAVRRRRAARILLGLRQGRMRLHTTHPLTHLRHGTRPGGSAAWHARARATRSAGSKSKSTAPLDDDEQVVDEGEEELPKDEAGRRKIKRQYEELLGIRIEKLKGRILNRERINKTIEGIYFICASCKKICHNIDDGLVEDPNNVNNLCTPCATAKEPRGGKGKSAA